MVAPPHASLVSALGAGLGLPCSASTRQGACEKQTERLLPLPRVAHDLEPGCRRPLTRWKKGVRNSYSYIALPDGLPAASFAAAIRGLLAGTRGFVGSPTFLEETARPRMQRWLRAPQDLELFRQHCRAPIVEGESTHWQLQFFFFTPRGAVESWCVTGRPNVIDDVQVSNALPAGTFQFPYVD